MAMTKEAGEVIMAEGRNGEAMGTKPKERKPLKKRMRNVVLSPLHLFQKYVLRKKKRSNRKTKQVEEEPQCKNNDLSNAAVESAKRRKLTCYFLFVGLTKSGKSTTISKLFNMPRPTQNPDPSDLILIHQNSDVGDNLGLKVVDCPGFSGENLDSDMDAQKAHALSAFLGRDLPSRIPTVTFLVWPFDDREDNHNHSKFANVLASLSHLRQNITDDHHSNLILLLTHSQRTEETLKESDRAKLIAGYQAELQNLFPGVISPVPVVLIENFRYSYGKPIPEGAKRYHDLVFEALQKLAENREDHPFQKVVNWLSQTPKRFSVPMKTEGIPLSKFQSNFHRPPISPVLSQKTYEPYFVLLHRDEAIQNGEKRKSKKKRKNPSNQKRIQTCIPAGSQLVLANKMIINIEDCLVGDKLFSMDYLSTPVITRIRRENLDENGALLVGTIHCAVKSQPQLQKEQKQTSENINDKLIYKYENQSFAVINLAKAVGLEKVAATNNKTVYFIEIDSEDGTFVLNGFACFAQYEM